jgi:hypothetical protein
VAGTFWLPHPAKPHGTQCAADLDGTRLGIVETSQSAYNGPHISAVELLKDLRPLSKAE